MTATDELRRMLTDAGVEWEAPASYDGSTKHDTIVDDYWFHEYDGRITVHGLTPEQAIAATLGRDNAGRYVGLRQGEYWERAENSNYYCGGCGWKVTDHDSYCPECGGALHKATLGRGTCRLHDCDGSFSSVNRPVWRCDCGAFMTQYTDATTYHKPRFCPNCGRRCVG